MSKFSKVLVALAGGALDSSLLLQLRLMSRAFAPTIVHAVTVLVPPTFLGPTPKSPEQLAEQLEQDARRSLDEFHGTMIISAVLRGNRLDALLRYVTEHAIDLLIVGHRRGARSRGLARRLARKAPCAILMVTDGSAAAVGRVLVPVDFSDDSGRTLDIALDLCRAYGLLECMVLNVYSRGETARIDEDRVNPREEASQLQQFLDKRQTSGVKIVSIFEEAEDVVSGVAQVVGRTSADLVCMGARGRSRAAAILLGSATEDVLAASTCPVLIVRTPGRSLSLLDVVVERVFTEHDRPRPV